jgi:hypothetical protein
MKCVASAVVIIAALALSACGSTRTKTVTEQSSASQISTRTGATGTETTTEVKSRPHRRPRESPPKLPPDLRSCGNDLSVNSVTTCPFAANVYSAYQRSGQTNVMVSAYSPVTTLTYAMGCRADGGTIICVGGHDALVSFPQTIAERGSGSQTNTQTTTPEPASCSPLSDEGTCYRPGEFCRDSDHNQSGTDENGDSMICEDKDGWRWESN